jgi:hypothetical protein
MGQIFSRTLRGAIATTPPSLSHICSMAPISPAVSIPHDPALLCPTSILALPRSPSDHSMGCLHSWCMCQCTGGALRGCLVALLSLPSLCLARWPGPFFLGQEQAMSFLTVTNVEVLNSNIDFLHLEFRTVGLIVSFLSTVPAQDVSYWQQGSTTRVLHKCHPIVIWVLDALLPCRHLVVIQKMRCFNDGLREVVFFPLSCCLRCQSSIDRTCCCQILAGSCK